MRTIEEIYEGMLAAYRRETGESAGAVSDLSVRLYAVAAQVYALYVQNDWLGRQCFPQTAAGEFLERHAALRGLERRDAAKALGSIRFSVETAAGTDLTIPAGTVCMTAGQVRFETTQTAVLAAGQTSVEAAAQAAVGGVSGNAAAGSVLTMAVPPVGIAACSNPAAFTGGADQEDDEGLRTRVLDTFKRMPNGANAAFYQQGAMSFDQVAAATVISRARGKGTVDVVVTTAAGLPDADLLAELTRYFESRREIAVDVQVKAPAVKPVNVTLRVTPAEGVEAGRAKTAAENALYGWFDGRRLSKDVLLAEVSRLVFSLDEVANCTISAPAADVAVALNELPTLGTLTVSEAAA